MYEGLNPFCWLIVWYENIYYYGLQMRSFGPTSRNSNNHT